MKINNCKELWEEWMGDPIDDSMAAENIARDLLRRWVFKGTECGCVFESDEKGIIVGGYAEGSDAEIPMYDLEWGFTLEEWDAALDAADKEGCIAWHEAHDQDLASVVDEYDIGGEG